MCGGRSFGLFEQMTIKAKENQMEDTRQTENFTTRNENGSFQSVSDFDDEQTRGWIPEQTRRMQQSENPVNTPYRPAWKPKQSWIPRRNAFNNMNKSLQEEESGFHFRIAKLNCNYSSAISKFSVCSINPLLLEFYYIFQREKSNDMKMLTIITVYAGDFAMANGLYLRNNKGEPVTELKIKGNLTMLELKVYNSCHINNYKCY